MGRVWTPGGLVNGGMVNAGHGLVNAGLIRVHAPINVLLTGLDAYYKFDEASGNAIDAVNSFDLTDIATVTAAGGLIVGSRQFTYTNSERFDSADYTYFNYGNTSFTLAGWIYPDSVPIAQGGIFGRCDTSGNYVLRAHLFDGGSSTVRVSFQIYDDISNLKTVTPATTMALSTWHYLVCWYDAGAGTVNININDSGAQTTAGAAGMGTTTQKIFRFGTSIYTTSYYNGRLDEWGIWNRVLSSTEQTLLYNEGAGLPFSSFG